MADYLIAIKPVLAVEGGYANDPNDRGGETFRGIARKFWTNWGGWKYVDVKDFKNPILNDLVMSFYKVNFWNPIGGDKINSQPIANILVDSAVNEGISPAIKRAEVIVGLPETGHISDTLINKLNSLT
jgi:lysozyme family protein